MVLTKVAFFTPSIYMSTLLTYFLTYNRGNKRPQEGSLRQKETPATDKELQANKLAYELDEIQRAGRVGSFRLEAEDYSAAGSYYSPGIGCGTLDFNYVDRGGAQVAPDAQAAPDDDDRAGGGLVEVAYSSHLLQFAYNSCKQLVPRPAAASSLAEACNDGITLW